MNPEQQCIEYALRYNQQLLEKEIRDARLWSTVELPSFRKGWITWKPTLKGRVGQIFLIPLALLLLGLTVPITSFLNLFDQRQRKSRLRKEKQELAILSPPYQGPLEKRFDTLWRSFGLDERFGLECQIHLMERWVEILYGADRLSALNLKDRAEAISRRHMRANSAWYRREENASHFSLKPVAETLAREIAGELPPYQL